MRRLIIAGALAVASVLVTSPRTFAQTPALCDPEPANTPRPLWPEIAPPLGSGYPEYDNVSKSVWDVKTIRLLASVATRSFAGLADLSNQLEYAKSTGRCVCSLFPFEVDLGIRAEDCTSTNHPYCENVPQAPYPLWLPTDLFGNPNGSSRFLLATINFFDEIDSVISQVSTAVSQSAIGQTGIVIKNLDKLDTMYKKYVDLLTEGFHLGGYSKQRPDLHLCVGYGGSGVLAEMANLGGVVSIGGRYKSENLSAEHRSQSRYGGFGAVAFDKAISVYPGIEGNLQIDGFRMWDTAKPFGINLSLVVDPSCSDGPGFRIADFEKYDIFHIFRLIYSKSEISQSELGDLDTSKDGCLQYEEWEFFPVNRYPVDYTSASDGQPYVWPRASFPYDYEKQNTAVFSTGLVLPLEMTTPKINVPPTGIPLAPGVTLYPALELKAGIEWTHEANGLRARIQNAINKNLPAATRLGPDDFERLMHHLQAPDVTEDTGTKVHVAPRISANLFMGIPVKKDVVEIGFIVKVGYSVRVEPAAYGGLLDMNVAIANALVKSNPPLDQPCDPIIEITETKSCSNELYADSTGVYDCDCDGVVDLYCGCEAYGICTVVDSGPDGIQGTPDDIKSVTHDATAEDCGGSAVCTAVAVNAGAPCETDADCYAKVCVGGATAYQACTSGSDCGGTCEAMQCVNGARFGQACMSDSDCPGPGDCQFRSAPCEPVSPVGYFTAYECLDSSQATITGWQGPGCHPLSVGFPSACGCATHTDCVVGQEACVDGACSMLGSPVGCTCDPGSCPSGRVCREGACLVDCTASGTGCAASQTCVSGACVSQFGIPFAEQIIWRMKNGPNPRHSVATYALSDVTTSAFLDAGMELKLVFKIFNKERRIPLFDFTDIWKIVSLTKSRYQQGLEAQYQHDCSPVAGNTVSNWQPGAARVNRYNPSSTTGGTYGNAGTLSQLEQWCSATLPNDVQNPPSPTAGDISGSVTDVVKWGQDIGLDLWAQSSLCVGEKPLSEFLIDLNGNPAGLQCSYTYNSATYTFPCGDADEQLLLIWGCLDTNASFLRRALADEFNGINDPLNISTTFNGRPVFDLSKMLIAPTGQFHFGNLKSKIRNHKWGAWWYQAVSECFETNLATVGRAVTVALDVGPCCGNGTLNQSGCGKGPGTCAGAAPAVVSCSDTNPCPTGQGPCVLDLPPCEECDDHNTVAGDGCSPVCTIECPELEVSVCGNGFLDKQDLEECDDGNSINGDGCDTNCTISRCGNGVVAPGEQCDDGNTVAGDGCSPTCQLAGVSVGSANPAKCQSTIAKEVSKFADAKMKAIQKCKDAVVTGKLPAATDCHTEIKSAEKVAKARAKVFAKIHKACGGADKLCGGGDDDSLDSIGWNIGACPNFEGGVCSLPIVHCGDIATCLLCINDVAVDQAITLYYDRLVPAPPASAGAKCQRAIGGETAKFFRAKLKALQKCWDGRVKGKHPNVCPVPGDGKALAKIVKAELKKIQAICKACGGADGHCDGDVRLSTTAPGFPTVVLGSRGGDDLTPAAIGFADHCPNVTVPGGPSCCGPVATLADLVTCVDCVTEFKADCVALANVPSLVPYPVECSRARGH